MTFCGSSIFVHPGGVINIGFVNARRVWNTFGGFDVFCWPFGFRRLLTTLVGREGGREEGLVVIPVPNGMEVSYASDSTEAPGDNEDGFHHMPSLMLPYIDMALFDQEELGKLARCENMQVQEHRLHKYEVPVPEIDKEVFSESRSSKLQGFHAVLLDKMEEEEGEGGSSSSSEEENDENDEDFSLSSKSGRGRAQKRIARSVQGEPPKKVQRANQKVINVVGASSSALAATNVEAYVNVHDKSKGKLKAKVGSEEEEEVQIVIGHEFGKVDHKGRHMRYVQMSQDLEMLARLLAHSLLLFFVS